MRFYDETYKFDIKNVVNYVFVALAGFLSSPPFCVESVILGQFLNKIEYFSDNTPTQMIKF